MLDLSTLNPGQQEAVMTEHPRMLCLAGAGTGKTHSMIARIIRMVESGVSPASILVLTFTNAAAFEMKSRYRKQVPTGRSPEFRTFHSFCYYLISKDADVRKAVGYFKVPRVVSTQELRSIKNNLRQRLGLKISTKVLDHQVAPTGPREERELEVYEKAYWKELREQNVITFDMLCYRVCKLFTQGDECILKYRKQYRHILVDEFQDTDPRQFQFVTSFHDSTIFVVGDALQSLYAFRNADSSIIKALSVDSEWKTVRLELNYRSTAQICKFANGMSTYADDTYRIALTPTRPEGESVTLSHGHSQSFNDPVDFSTITDIVKQIQTNCEGTTAVLCRTNREVEYLTEKLEGRGISCWQGKRNEEAEYILNGSVDNQFLMDWLATYLSSEKYSEFIRVQTLTDEYGLSQFLNDFGNLRAVRMRVDKVSQVRRLFKEKLPMALRIRQILDVLKVNNVPDETILEMQATTARELVQILVETIQNIQDNGTYVGTVHSAKGLEYNNVFVVNVGQEKVFPLDSEDNLNVYYVAITRAKDRLMIYTN